MGTNDVLLYAKWAPGVGFVESFTADSVSFNMVVGTIITIYAAVTAGIAEYAKSKPEVKEVKLPLCKKTLVLTAVRFADLVAFSIAFITLSIRYDI